MSNHCWVKYSKAIYGQEGPRLFLDSFEYEEDKENVDQKQWKWSFVSETGDAIIEEI